MSTKKNKFRIKETTPSPSTRSAPTQRSTSSSTQKSDKRTGKGVPPKRPSESGLPLARYTSVLGTQSLLLAFTALFLPRSTVSVLGEGFLPPPSSSLDRPEHPFLVPLTANPVLTLVWLVLGVAIVSAWAGGYSRVWAVGGNEENKSTVIEGRAKAIRNAWMATFAAALVFHLTIVLFGAPLTTYVLRTFLFGFLLSLLTVYIPVYTLGFPTSSVDRLTFIRLFCECSPRTHLERVLVYPSLGTLIGCWVGTFVLPLDWDRPWQAWPLVPAYMAILGHIVGAFVALGKSAILSLADVDVRAKTAKAS